MCRRIRGTFQRVRIREADLDRGECAGKRDWQPMRDNCDCVLIPDTHIVPYVDPRDVPIQTSSGFGLGGAF